MGKKKKCIIKSSFFFRYLYSKAANENIEFEDLVTAEKKAVSKNIFLHWLMWLPYILVSSIENVVWPH